MNPSIEAVRRPNVLLVDDDPNSLRVLHSVLDSFADITFAKSGEQALVQISERLPDLVLLDTEMPGMGGYLTCASLKESPETADLPVIFVTSCASAESETRALAIGAADFIHKPINPPVVLARVKTQLALKHKTDELRRLTAQDALTGIANRRAFDDALRREWNRAMRNGEPLSVMMVDVDHFKQFNDTYGHPKGDDCLRQVAHSLAHNARRAGDFVARYGGEEFVMILPHTNPSDAKKVAEVACSRVTELAIPHCKSSTAPIVTISIGVATIGTPCNVDAKRVTPCGVCSSKPSCNAAPSALIALADQALYAAKQQGRNRAVSYAGTSDSVLAA